ncbi:MAG: AAA family ATPase [Terracidiphilus sp.]
MLKRIYIDNFRCFVNFEYKPERKQLLLGANGSGKSSLLDAVHALKTFLAARGNNFENQRAFQSNATRWLNLPLQVFEIEVEIAGSQYVYRLENDVSHPNSSASVAAESLKVDGSPILEVTNGEATLYLVGGAAPISKFRISDSSSALPILSASRGEAGLFADWLSKQLFCLKIVPNTMLPLGKFDGQTHPFSDLSDLAAWYMQLAGTDVESVIGLRDSLKETLAGFASLQFTGLESGVGELRTSFNSPGKPIHMGLNELSDGQRCLIALYMILHFLIAKGHTVILDEPDNFISLREIQPWLLAAEDAVEESKGQLILISHHPEILNYWAREYGLLFSREENGHVRTKAYREVAETGLDPAETVARGWEQ